MKTLSGDRRPVDGRITSTKHYCCTAGLEVVILVDLIIVSALLARCEFAHEGRCRPRWR
jgi:hypothetical protein